MDPTTTVDPNNILSAKGLVVAITGGGSGIGLAMASAIAQTGAKRIYLLGRRADVLSTAAATLNAKVSSSTDNPIVIALPTDVTSRASVAAAAARIERDVGHLDVLINNAGKTGPPNKAALEAASVAELQDVLLTGFADGNDGGDGEWLDTLRVNTASVALVSAAFLHLLDAGNARRGWEAGRVEGGRTRGRGKVEAGGGEVDGGDLRLSQIVTVASIAGFNRQVTAGVAYSASKAAAVHVGKMLATLLAPWGVRSNVIAPGVYPSAMTGEHDQEYPINQVPAGRKGSFDDITGLILYMVGKGGSYLNGSVQVTDGGRLSGFPSTY
ncbi:nad-binding protein [Diplodia corticola]|uniref:Nad-binding protein n=1 Tax=Diplodia corticola TaxID=236234 RepID=A0A1J9RRK7_9PEZI|nr:nad-binding protein [Diplodia corticola]OJD30532.1 nad-binding protein [Diplodia corticola]